MIERRKSTLKKRPRTWKLYYKITDPMRDNLSHIYKDTPINEWKQHDFHKFFSLTHGLEQLEKIKRTYNYSLNSSPNGTMWDRIYNHPGIQWAFRSIDGVHVDLFFNTEHITLGNHDQDDE